MKQEIEFEHSDLVTFNNYGNPIPATVIGIRPHKNVFREPDDRVFYTLTGIGHPLYTVTSGVSIVESRYFKPV